MISASFGGAVSFVLCLVKYVHHVSFSAWWTRLRDSSLGLVEFGVGFMFWTSVGLSVGESGAVVGCEVLGVESAGETIMSRCLSTLDRHHLGYFQSGLGFQSKRVDWVAVCASGSVAVSSGERSFA
jgi:hypothetical protein